MPDSVELRLLLGHERGRILVRQRPLLDLDFPGEVGNGELARGVKRGAVRSVTHNSCGEPARPSARIPSPASTLVVIDEPVQVGQAAVFTSQPASVTSRSSVFGEESERESVRDAGGLLVESVAGQRGDEQGIRRGQCVGLTGSWYLVPDGAGGEGFEGLDPPMRSPTGLPGLSLRSPRWPPRTPRGSGSPRAAPRSSPTAWRWRWTST